MRPGLALYGAEPIPGAPNPMRPVLQMTARVLQTRTVPAGAGVGYALTDMASESRRVATVACGYADGWPRRLGGKAGTIPYEILTNLSRRFARRYIRTEQMQ